MPLDRCRMLIHAKLESSLANAEIFLLTSSTLEGTALDPGEYPFGASDGEGASKHKIALLSAIVI